MILLKRLDDKQVFDLCSQFIRCRGYVCKLNLEDSIIKYLLKYQYITSTDKTNNWFYLNSKFYLNYRSQINSLNFTKIEIQLLKNYSPLRVIYFDNELMHLLINNPKIIFSWNGYYGYVCSRDDSMLSIYIKDLLLCHDLEKNRILPGIFMVDLLNLNRDVQNFFGAFLLDNDRQKYELNSYVVKNLIHGQFLDVSEESIYNVLLEGIKIVNFIFIKKHGIKLFKHEYAFDQLQFFMPLFYPTKVNYSNFLIELAKIFIDNLNGRGIKTLIRKNYDTMSNRDNIDLNILKENDVREFRLFCLYFGQYINFNKKSFEKLDQIRNLRTDPAHKVYINDLDYSYCNEQDDLLINIYRVLYDIIKNEDIDYKYLNAYENGSYISFFGVGGAISFNNGFNKSSYIYYNGYIRLNNEKFNVKDAEILIAYNDEKVAKRIINKKLHRNCGISFKDCDLITNKLMHDEFNTPSEKELESFFYGSSYIDKFYGVKGDYKKNGLKKVQNFLDRNYKHVIIIADKSELIYDIEKTILNFKCDSDSLYGSGLLTTGLSNYFSHDENDLFTVKSEDMFISCNVWD